MLLNDLITRAVQLFGDEPALVQNDTRMTYRELGLRVSKLAAGLQGLGLAPRERVAILSNNSFRYLETYLAIPEAGLVLSPINIRLAPLEVAFILNDGEIRALLVEREFLPLLDEIRGDLDQLEHVVLMDGPAGEGTSGGGMVGDGMVGYEELLQSADPPSLRPPEWDENEMVFLCYTGGTTGRPKGVMLSHRNVVAQCLHSIQLAEFNERTVWLHVSPMFHAADYWSCFAVSAVGGFHTFIEKFDPLRTLELIQQHRVTHLLLVPTMINLILESPGAGELDTSSVRRILYGSAPMPEARLKAAIELFGPVMQHLYGQTETAPFLTATTISGVHPEGTEAQRRRMMSCGQPILGLEVEVVDPEGNPVPPGGTGEIIARGPNVMLGYWNRPKETAAVLKNGWIHTGDIASIDEDRYIYILDRARDMIITGGENVHCPEVENILYKHPDVLDAAVIGIPDDTWGEAVKAIVVRAPGSGVNAEALISHCKESIAGFKCPRTIDFVDALPKSGVGKVLKHELRKPYWEGHTRAVH
ncbi:MAG: long-chain-fatty-acid--CoA ligase [bacterium]